MLEETKVISIYEITPNGSYILPNGVIVLSEEGMNAYLNIELID